MRRNERWRSGVRSGAAAAKGEGEEEATAARGDIDQRSSCSVALD